MLYSILVLYCGVLFILISLTSPILWYVIHPDKSYIGMLSILSCPMLWYVIHPDKSYTVVCYPSSQVLHSSLVSIPTDLTLWYVIHPVKSYTVVCYPPSSQVPHWGMLSIIIIGLVLHYSTASSIQSWEFNIFCNVILYPASWHCGPMLLYWPYSVAIFCLTMFLWWPPDHFVTFTKCLVMASIHFVHS